MLILLGVWAIGYLVPSLLLGVLFNVQVPNWLAFGHVYVLFGIYFTWYWTKTGQTLAMQTWHVKMVDQQEKLLNRNQALIRYAISTLWLIPTVLIYIMFKYVFLIPLGHWPTIELMFCMVLFFWPLTCLLDRANPNGSQSLADKLAKTQLIQIPKNKNPN
jgi:RDD family